MNWKTTLLLLALIASLGGLVLWQSAREEADVHLVDERMFEGVDIERVSELRIDNIYRGFSVRLERDEERGWMLTDPLEYPAELGLMQILLEDIEKGRIMPVAEGFGGEEELGFAPPKVVLDVIEQTPDGEMQHRVEIGEPDLDGRRVFVRVDGKYYRTLMRLHSTLDREVHDFRSLRALHLGGRDIVEVHRTGSVQYELDQAPVDLTLSAYLEGNALTGNVWHSALPVKARLDPMDVGVLVFGAVRMEIAKFVEDEVQDLSRYGLDLPVARVSLGLSDGSAESLLISRIGNTSGWYAMREGSTHVWSIEDQAVMRLFYPFEAMLEGHFMNSRRREVSSLLLANASEELRLQREPRAWTLQVRPRGGEWSEPLRADSQVVEDWLARLETLEVESFLLGEGTPADPGELTIHVETPSGLQGGRFGAVRELQGGERRRLYLRDGDEVAGLVPTWTAELAQSTRFDFLSLELLALEEVLLAELVLKHEGQTLNYTRDDRALWHAAGSADEATNLLGVLDPLLFLKAAEHLPSEVELEDLIEVSFVETSGKRVDLAVGTAPGPEGQVRVIVDMGSTQATAKLQGLHAKLLALFEE